LKNHLKDSKFSKNRFEYSLKTGVIQSSLYEDEDPIICDPGAVKTVSPVDLPSFLSQYSEGTPEINSIFRKISVKSPIS